MFFQDHKRLSASNDRKPKGLDRGSGVRGNFRRSQIWSSILQQQSGSQNINGFFKRRFKNEGNKRNKCLHGFALFYENRC